MSTTVSSARTANTPSKPSFRPKMTSPGSSLGGPLPSEPALTGSTPSFATLLSRGSSCGNGAGVSDAWFGPSVVGRKLVWRCRGGRVFHSGGGREGRRAGCGRRDAHRWRRIGAAVALGVDLCGHVWRRAPVSSRGHPVGRALGRPMRSRETQTRGPVASGQSPRQSDVEKNVVVESSTNDGARAR